MSSPWRHEGEEEEEGDRRRRDVVVFFLGRLASCAAGSMLRPISLRSPTDFESWCQCVSVLYAKINMLDLRLWHP